MGGISHPMVITDLTHVGMLFPGQGAQFVGMGADLHAEFSEARDIYTKADEILGYSIAEICFKGPEDKLTRTEFAQPAIYVTSMAILQVLKSKFPALNPKFTAGLSLGEFSALTAAGALHFVDGLRLVKARAEAMESAANASPGTMASILGLSSKDCEILAKAAGCEVANLNSPDQTVLSGTHESIDQACERAEAQGAKRAIKLKVSGAFHSRLMSEARRKLEAVLSTTTIKAPQCLFVPNAKAAVVADPDEIRRLLADQLTHPVRWVETLLLAENQGILNCLETGPGKVIKGLAKRTCEKLSVEPCGTVSDIRHLEQLIQEVNR